MKTLYKVAVAIFSILVILTIVANLPMIPTNMLVARCSHPTSCAAANYYESISQQLLSGCCGVLVATTAYAVLSSGTASSPSQRGTANLAVGILNPGSNTTITEILVSSSPGPSGLNDSNSMTVYQCPSASYCNPFPSPIVWPRSLTSFNASETAFYFGSNVNTSAIYYYVVDLANGQSISGQFTAR